MKAFVTISLVALTVFGGTALHAQTFRDYANRALQGTKTGNKNTGKWGSGSSSGSKGTSIGNLSNQDIVSGLKQALQVGTQNSANKLSAINGFFGNPLIKIPLPPEAANVENTLRQIGLGSQVDETVLALNRAAEDAAGKAVPIFINAISSMSIQDGLSILQGGSNAATNFLRGRTTAALTSAFRPVIEGSLAKVNATRYWNNIFTAYNQVPFVEKVNPDLTGYVTERALNGLFVTIAGEEAKIRANPSARVTSLLQKVFGAH
ncbi:MAG: DUF4197 domain-containing protein [Taibaiella sp.]|nr:DUF4197 domain-containing protein [Taibaiella sp.]